MLSSEQVASFRAIESDTLSGSVQIMYDSAELFKDILQLDKYDKSDLLAIAKGVLRAHPDMLLLHRLCQVINMVINSGTAALLKAMDSFINNYTHNKDRLVKKLGSIVEDGDSIFIHSNSSLIRDSLLDALALGKAFQVYVSEARPNYEGVLMAKALCAKGVHVTLVVDAAAYLMLERCDKIFLSCDHYCNDHFVNKIATMSLLLYARYKGGITSYLLSDNFKRSPHDLAINTTDNCVDEIFAKADAMLRLENPYFEKIPLELIDIRLD